MRAPDFWRRDGFLPWLLSPAAALYNLVSEVRKRRIPTVRAPVPVICIGNLVAGGAGKTPVALAVIDKLKDRKLNVHALTRGYGGRLHGPVSVDRQHHAAAEVGDEALLLARVAPTWVARDRPAGARAAAGGGAEVVVMDDGFQNPSLHKDLSFVVIDGSYGFGNDRVLPAGPLREPSRSGLMRADAVILVGPEVDALHEAIVAHLRPGCPILHARILPVADDNRFAGKRVLAFAGIGLPEKFYSSLRGLDAEIVETRDFPDHHAYSDREIATLMARAEALDAVPVTTEKDAVRLSPAVRAGIATLPVALVWEDSRTLEQLFDSLRPSGELHG